MKRLLLTLCIAALGLPGVALGKGPSEATLTGPGIGTGLTITGGEGDGSVLSNLSTEAGFFAGAFTQEPSLTLAERPKGDLGPKYTVLYTVPDGDGAPSMITQDVYPYAKPLPVTYMAPGQPIFGEQTAGGWYPATSGLKDVLVAAGLPAKPIASPAPASSPASDGRSLPTAVVVALGGLLLLAATAFLLRRRLRPGARMAGSPS